MTADSDSLDSDPTASPAYILFVSPLEGFFALANVPEGEYLLLNPAGYNYLTAPTPFAFEIDVDYYFRLYLNEGDFKCKIWEGDEEDAPEEWNAEVVDPDPRVTGQFMAFALFSPTPTATDEILIDNVTVRGVGTTAVETNAANQPNEFSLAQNYPNPFNPSTEIVYTIIEQGHVNVSIFNQNGQLVNTLSDNIQIAGNHRLNWNATNMNGSTVPSGLYYCRVTSGDMSQTIKMVYLR